MNNELKRGIEFLKEGEMSKEELYNYNMKQFNQYQQYSQPIPTPIIQSVTEDDILNNALCRNNMMDKLYVLGLVCNLITLPDNIHSTIEMTAKYFQVEKKTIEKVIERNYLEISGNGLIVLSGKDLKDYKNNLTDIMSVTSSDDVIDNYISKFSPSLTLLNRRAILNIAMLLRDSYVAKEIRKVLLDTIETPQGQSAILQTIYNQMMNQQIIIDSMKDDISEIKNNTSKKMSTTRNPIVEE